MDLWRNTVSPEETVGESLMIERLLACPPKSCLLDAPCGSGSHAIELAGRGHQVTAIDISQTLIREAKAKANILGRQLEIQQADMRQMVYEAKFDGAYCLGSSIGYLEHDDLELFFVALARSLKPGGRFLIQTSMAAESILPNLKEREWHKTENAHLLIENRYHTSNSCLETEYTVVQNGRTETRRSWHWVFTAAEIQRLLERSALRVIDMHSGLDGKPFKLGSPRLFLLGDKI